MKSIIILLLIGYARSTCKTYEYYWSYCNDMEMFAQCDRAQQQVNNFANLIIGANNTYELLNRIPDLECDRHIYCKVGGSNACQNMQSYLQCNRAEPMLNDFIAVAQSIIEIPENILANKPDFRCHKQDGVHEFYENDGNMLQVSIVLIASLLLISL